MAGPTSFIPRMLQREDGLFTIATESDLHESEFYLLHYKFNQHVDLTIPRGRDGHHTLHLCGAQCYELGLRLLKFAEEGTISLTTLVPTAPPLPTILPSYAPPA